jgi:hypothetical protein
LSISPSTKFLDVAFPLKAPSENFNGEASDHLGASGRAPVACSAISRGVRISAYRPGAGCRRPRRTVPGRSIRAPTGAPPRSMPGGAGANVRTAARTLAPVANPSSTRIAAMPSRSRGGRFPGWTRSRRRSSAHPRSATSRRSCGPIFHTLSFQDDHADAGDRPQRPARHGPACPHRAESPRRQSCHEFRWLANRGFRLYPSLTRRSTLEELGGFL